jgi:hypothetical protein
MIKHWGKARTFRLVPAAVFIYDCSRFFFLIALLSVYLKTGLEFNSVNFPMVMFVSPNALFPLMSFFLLIRFKEYKAYIPLYIMGKFLGMLCIMIWLLVMLGLVFNAREILWAVFLGAADLATIMGTIMLSDDKPQVNTIAETTPVSQAAPVSQTAAEGGGVVVSVSPTDSSIQEYVMLSATFLYRFGLKLSVRTQSRRRSFLTGHTIGYPCKHSFKPHGKCFRIVGFC